MVQFNEAEKEKSDNNPCTWIRGRNLQKHDFWEDWGDSLESTNSNKEALEIHERTKLSNCVCCR